MERATAQALRDFREAYTQLLLKAEQLKAALESAAGTTTDPVWVILHTVAEVFETTPQVTLGRSRTNEDIEARWVSMWLCRELLGKSTVAIGRTFSRDHATVINACRQIRGRMQADHRFGALALLARERAKAAIEAARKVA